MDLAIIITFAIVSVLILISSIDDLFIDLLALLCASPRPPAETPGRSLAAAPCGTGLEGHTSFGVFVANWHEADVLERMIEGNLETIRHRPLTFYLGVYPNDVETREAAQRLAKKHPALVKVIVNSQPGPTTKGQMLNEMFAQVYDRPLSGPDLVVIHDSEDIIDPRSFGCYASAAAAHDFIQIPVFSLDSRHRSLVGATYMEEFAERHTREMAVRNTLGAPIPSAGVGTCVTRRLIMHFLKHRGALFNAGSVTEDYVLGIDVHRMGFRSTFAVVQAEGCDENAIIATREYFPKGFWAAVKQKTRWIYGISFEGTRHLGWKGTALDRFFMYRDRKGAITNLLPPLAAAVLAVGLWRDLQWVALEDTVLAATLQAVLIANGLAMLFRFAIKLRAFRRVHGFFNFWGLLLRVPVAITVNALAVLRAWNCFLLESRLATAPIAWSKTAHEVPDDFNIWTPAHLPGAATVSRAPVAVQSEALH